MREDCISLNIGIKHSGNGFRDNWLHEADVSKKILGRSFMTRHSLSLFTKQYFWFPSRQEIADLHAELQEHCSHRHNKRDIRGKTITEGENNSVTAVNVVIVNWI